jgi:HPt (histidine-containing phosphotransfer) domain-containing protein
LLTEDAPAQIEAARAALECTDMRAVAAVAHTLKGALRALAADRGASLAERLEADAHDGDLAAARTVFTEFVMEVEALVRTMASWPSGDVTPAAAAIER